MFPAILTTVLFALSATSAARSTRLLGASRANFCRLVLATLMLGTWAHTMGTGLGGGALGWFLLSGMVGFGLGDLGLYAAYPRIGARLGVLLCLCLSVPLGTLLEWAWLGTRMTPAQLLFSGLICVGVILALAPERIDPAQSRSVRIWGTLFGVTAAAGQALGAVLSRRAYAAVDAVGLHVDGATAAYQRILGGMVVLLVAMVLRRGIGRRGGAISADRWRAAWPWVLLNSLSGPAIGVACFQWALAVAPTGLVLAIVAMTPLVVIPFSWVLEGERPSVRSLAGGAVAVAGAVALTLIR